MSLTKPKRGRGRPKKILTSTEIREKEAKPKRGRGRPKKILTSTEIRENEAKPKRARGRPKKILTSTEIREKEAKPKKETNIFHKTKRGTSTLSPFLDCKKDQFSPAGIGFA